MSEAKIQTRIPNRIMHWIGNGIEMKQAVLLRKTDGNEKTLESAGFFTSGSCSIYYYIENATRTLGVRQVIGSLDAESKLPIMVLNFAIAGCCAKIMVHPYHFYMCLDRAKDILNKEMGKEIQIEIQYE